MKVSTWQAFLKLTTAELWTQHLDWFATHPSVEKRRQIFVLILPVALLLGLLRPFSEPSLMAQNTESVIAQPASSNDSKESKIDGGPRFSIVDEHEQPVSDVQIEFVSWTGSWELTGITKTTDIRGRVEFESPPKVSGYLYTLIKSKDYVPILYKPEVDDPSELDVELILARPTDSWIRVVDPNGQPIAGAEFQFIRYVDQNRNEMYVDQAGAVALGLELSTSDPQGRLVLPKMPAGVSASTSVFHPKWSPAHFKVEATDGLLSTVTLQKGVAVRIHLEDRGKNSVPIPSRDSQTIAGDRNEIPAEYRNYSSRGPKAKGSASPPDDTFADIILFPRNRSIREAGIRHRLPVVDGMLEFTANQADYTELRISVPDYFVGPMLVNFAERPVEKLDMRKAESVEFSLDAYRKVPVRGRVIDYRGDPVAEASVSGILVHEAIANSKPPEGEAAKTRWMKLVTSSVGAGNAETDKDGYYTIDLADGHAMVEVIHSGFFSEPSSTTVHVATGENVVIPDITLFPVPILKGIVSYRDRPVVGAIVRMRSRGRGDAEPVSLTNDSGEFELRMSRIPYAEDGDGLETTASIVAFHPRRDVGGIVDVDLTDDAQTSQINVELSTIEAARLVQPWKAASIEIAEPVRKDEHQEAREAAFADGLPGKSVPAMTEGSWLNTHAHSLEDFRGRFVLLDFWFIGCGPCYRDMPQLKIAHEGFPNQKFAIVAVHTNASSTERVLEFSRKEKMEYAIVVDDSAGNIVEQYRKIGVTGFPSYILIDPHGKIAHNDGVSGASTFGGNLRQHKLEIINQAIQEWDWTN